MRVILFVLGLSLVALAQQPEAQCGNGVIDQGEECDDFNLFDDDGCSAECKIEDRFRCEGEPSECLPFFPQKCFPTRTPSTESTTPFVTTVTVEETTAEGQNRTTIPASSTECPPIACPTDCDLVNNKYRLSRDANGCQFCRCVPRRNPGGDDNRNSRGRRTSHFNDTTTEVPTTTTPLLVTTTTLSTTTDLLSTTENPQCPVDETFVVNCTCLTGYRVMWEFVNDCPTCHCVPREPEVVRDICVLNTTTFGEACNCTEECHACNFRDGLSGDCLVCTTLFLFSGRCIDTCPPGTIARDEGDYRRTCQISREPATSTTEGATTTGETTTGETTTGETTTGETTTGETTTGVTTTGVTTTAETTTGVTTTAETTTGVTTTGVTTTGVTTTGQTTTGQTTTGQTTTGQTTTGQTTTGGSTTAGSTTAESTTAENGTTTEELTTIVFLCNGIPDPVVCLNLTLLNCTQVIGNITVNTTCPVTCNTCNETTGSTAIPSTTLTASAAGIIEGAAIANNVAAAANTANPGMIVGLTVLAVVFVAAVVGLVVRNKRRQRQRAEEEVIIVPPSVQIAEASM